jgi:hypothetical protein
VLFRSIYSFATGAKIADGRLINISLGGALVNCAGVLEHRVTYVLKFAIKNRKLELPGRVAWDAPRDPRNPSFHRYGIQFNLTAGQEQPLRELMLTFKRPPAPQPREFMRDYWNL